MKRRGPKRKHQAAHARASLLTETSKSHLRLCHFCLHLNESEAVVSKCERCKKSLKNAGEAEELYQKIAQIVTDPYSDLHEELTQRVQLDEEEGKNEEEEEFEGEEFKAEDIEAFMSEMLPLTGLSVVW